MWVNLSSPTSKPSLSEPNSLIHVDVRECMYCVFKLNIYVLKFSQEKKITSNAKTLKKK